MAHIVFLDFTLGEIVKAKITEEELAEIDNEFNGAPIDWACEKEKDKEWGINIDNCQWMWFADRIEERVV